MHEQAPNPASPLDSETSSQPGDDRRQKRPDVPVGKSYHQRAPPGHNIASISISHHDAHGGQRAEQRPNAEDQNPSCPSSFNHYLTSICQAKYTVFSTRMVRRRERTNKTREAGQKNG